MNFNRNIFDPDLRDLSPNGIIGDLADTWETSADGKVWTFNLNKDAKWHDGTDFTADDVVFSLDKMIDKERSGNAAAFGMYESSVAVDADTVKVTLKYASPSFLAQLAGPYSSINAKHMADVDWKSTDFIIGTGPFKFKSSVPGVSYEFERNADYHKSPYPYLDGIKMEVMSDRSGQMDALITGRLDSALWVLGTYDEDLTQRVKSQNKDLVWDSYANAYGMMWWLNQDYAPFKDVRVRQAITMMFDRPTLTVAGFGSVDWGNAEHAIFPPAFGLETAEINKIMGWDKPVADRTAIAKKLLADAGQEGFTVRILVRNVAQLERQVVLMADILKRELGLDTVVESVEITVLKERRAAGDYDVILEDTRSYVGEPSDVTPLFQSGSSSNWFGYSNAEADKLIDAQNKEMDVSKRIQQVRDLERILLEDHYVIPQEWRQYQHAKAPYVKGLYMQDVGYGSRGAWERVWLDK